MIPAENIRDWRGHPVVDLTGDKIGTLEAVYVDTATDAPAFLSIQVGIVGRHRLTFAPLTGAVVSPDYVKITATKKQVKGAPSIDTDGELAADAEPALFEHYGLTYPQGGQRQLARR